MPTYREEFHIQRPLESVRLACKEAVADLGWKVIEEDEFDLVCKEHQQITSFTWAATFHLSLYATSTEATRIVVEGSNFGFGPIQKNHLKGQGGNLRNKISVASESSENTPQNSLTAEIERLAELREQGILSEEEFHKAKSKLLND